MTRTLPPTYSSPDLVSVNLTRLVERLESNILSSSAQLEPLRSSQFHRARVGANIEYAQTLLDQAKRSLPNIKIPARRHAVQTDLGQKRQTIEALRERLQEIAAEAEAAEQVGGEDPDPTSTDDDDAADEDLLATPETASPDIVTDNEHRTGTETETEGEGEGAPRTPSTSSMEQSGYIHELEAESESDPTTTEGANAPALSPTQTHSQTLRQRHRSAPSGTGQDTSRPSGRPEEPPDRATATATGSAPSHTRAPTHGGQSKAAVAEDALARHRVEQETLTDSLLGLATQLRQSSHTFSSSLETEKSVLARAVEGLDRNTTGMDAAGKRMGMLRRMTEGRGWWGRVLMYAWIFGLWIVALLIVYVGPKLRF